MKTSSLFQRILTAIRDPFLAIMKAENSAGRKRQVCPISLGLATMAILSCLANSLAAEQFGKFTYTDDGNSITITRYPYDEAGTVEIPANIVGKPVTCIGDSSFSNCSRLTSVVIPDSVIIIEHAAFFACSNVADVTIPNRITTIGMSAFNSCSKLIAVSIPDSVISIGEGAFQNCISLKNVTIGAGVTGISCSLFGGCKSLTSITMSNSVTSISAYAFSSCSSLISVTIPTSITRIGNNAFSYCYSLTNFTIPSGVTSIGDDVFSECESLTVITVESANPFYSSVSGILFNKNQTQLIKYPGGKVGGYAVPNSVTGIGASAFEHCNSLTSVTIPDSVASIGKSAFYHCISLTSVIIGNAVTDIGEFTFGECRSLTDVAMPDSATSIGKSAFFFCSSLTSITIPNSVTTIGESAFGYCGKLIRVTIPDSVTNIGESAFNRCGSLASITIPDNVTSIAPWTFGYCSSLVSVNLHEGVTTIGYAAFSSCSSLTSVTIPSSVNGIGNWTFANCSSLTSVIFLGDAPTAGENILGEWNFDVTVYYVKGHAGFTSPTWLRYASVALFATSEIAITDPIGTQLTDDGAVIDFGTVYLGANGRETFTITNGGITELSGIAIIKDGTHAANFIITNLGATELSPAAQTTFTVTFKPGTNGPHTAILHIGSNDSDENPFDIALEGTGITSPEIVVQQPAGRNLTDGVSSKSFGSVAVKSKVAKTFTIRNTGTAKLKKLSVTKTGTNAGNFTIKAPLMNSLSPGASTTFKVVFNPSTKGPCRAFIQIRSNDSNENPFDITVTGKGIASHSRTGLAEFTISAPGISNVVNERMRSVASTMRIHGGRFRCLTIFRNGKADPDQDSVEVSSNLVDWFSGPKHTTVMENTADFLMIRDNISIAPRKKRFIRVRNLP